MKWLGLLVGIIMIILVLPYFGDHSKNGGLGNVTQQQLAVLTVASAAIGIYLLFRRKK